MIGKAMRGYGGVLVCVAAFSWQTITLLIIEFHNYNLFKKGKKRKRKREQIEREKDR